MKQFDQHLMRQVRMFLGVPPYNEPGNPCRGDGYLIQDLKKTYGKAAVEAAIEQAKGE